jgi:D-cysteine desulfhydrase/L-cysteate sulfo-lyase
MTAYKTHDVLGRVGRFPRVDLIHRPTPLRKLERLTARLGGPEIYIKRDDLTGLAFGGNKSRKLEFIIRDMLEKRADVVITWGSLQSNWCMQTAAAARTFGIKPVLVLFKTNDLPPAVDGNLLLDVILGADIRILEAEKGKVVKSAQAMSVLEEAAREVRGQGHRPYLVPVGGSLVRGDMDKPLGAVSYVAAFAEIADEMRAGGIEPRLRRPFHRVRRDAGGARRGRPGPHGRVSGHRNQRFRPEGAFRRRRARNSPGRG